VNVVSLDRRSAPPPEIWRVPRVRTLIYARDIPGIYRELQKYGYSQQRIAALTGQSQPEVSNILHERTVQSYDVIHRIITGLGIPLCFAALASCCSCCTHRSNVPGRALPPTW
jgi:helix-turn-helix protein